MLFITVYVPLSYIAPQPVYASTAGLKYCGGKTFQNGGQKQWINSLLCFRSSLSQGDQEEMLSFEIQSNTQL